MLKIPKPAAILPVRFFGNDIFERANIIVPDKKHKLSR